MSQIFETNGKVIPVTVVKVEPNVAIQVKSKEKDGYEAVQLGMGNKRSISKALKGHFKNLGNFRYVGEFKFLKNNDQEVSVGTKFDASVFAVGDVIKVTATSKGKGFQGAVKRHGFHGAPASHGHHAVMRHIGSIGQRFPQHTLKGKRMAGHMGNETVTVRGLKIAVVDAENNLLAIKGALPGQPGALVKMITI